MLAELLQLGVAVASAAMAASQVHLAAVEEAVQVVQAQTVLSQLVAQAEQEGLYPSLRLVRAQMLPMDWVAQVDDTSLVQV